MGAGCFYYGSLQYIPVGIATLIGNLSPLWGAVMARIFLKEKISNHDLISIFICLIGVFFILNPFSLKDNKSKDEELALKNYFLGCSFTFMSTICAAIS